MGGDIIKLDIACEDAFENFDECSISEKSTQRSNNVCFPVNASLEAKALSCKTPARRHLKPRTRFQSSKNTPVMMQRGGTPVVAPHNVPIHSATRCPQESSAEVLSNVVAGNFVYVIQQLNGGEKGEELGNERAMEENGLRQLRGNLD